MKKTSMLLALALLLSIFISTPAQAYDACEKTHHDYQRDGCDYDNSRSNCIKLYNVNNKLPIQSSYESTDNLVVKSEKTVYITPTGKKYHRSSCRTIKKGRKTAISLSNAKKRGYKACKVCSP